MIKQRVTGLDRDAAITALYGLINKIKAQHGAGYYSLSVDWQEQLTTPFGPEIEPDEELHYADIAARNLRKEMSRIDQQAINRAFIEGDDAEAFGL